MTFLKYVRVAILSGYTFSKLTSFVVPINKQEMSKDFFCQNIFDNAFLYSIFNKADLRKLYVTAYTLKNDFKIEVLQYVEEQEDNYTWVFQEGGKLKYHLFYDCEGLKSKLEDFRIPFDYNNLLNGKVLVKKYREWFKMSNFKELYSLDPSAMDIIVERYNTDFAPKHHLPNALIEDFHILNLNIKRL